MKDFLYLCHPFDSRKWVREWELGIEKKLGITILNPFYDTGRQNAKDIDAGRLARYEIEPKKIVEVDIDLIKKSKGLVAFITGDLSYGTIQEMVYGKLYKKPVYSIVTNKHEKHPWLQYHSTKVFTELSDLEKFLSKL